MQDSQITSTGGQCFKSAFPVYHIIMKQPYAYLLSNYLLPVTYKVHQFLEKHGIKYNNFNNKEYRYNN